MKRAVRNCSLIVCMMAFGCGKGEETPPQPADMEAPPAVAAQDGITQDAALPLPTPDPADPALPAAAPPPAAPPAVPAPLVEPLNAPPSPPAAPVTAAAPAPVQKAAPKAKVTLRGIGSVQAGMTVLDAQKAVGQQLVKLDKYPSKGSCYFMGPASWPDDISFQIVDEKVVRIDVRANTVSTKSGARVGDTVKVIQTMYPGKLKESANLTNPAWKDYTYVPTDSADQPFRLVFVTDGKTVQAMKCGLAEAVALAEGCP